jgi:predicted PhzF superfamily epimerase YddE/YHI9
MAGQTIYQVDSFTTQVFKGNPAGVCILDTPRPEEWMKNLAGEMNLSETAFLVREGEVFRLRWFTPKAEVTLCGHATLASAHILWEQGILKPDQQAHFETLSGRLTATRSGEWIELNFPAREVKSVVPPTGLLEALGAVVTARAEGGEYDIVSRFFAPAVGVNEDPVTGSAHCALAPYWSEKLGKLELLAYQASGRGGNLQIRLEGERVILAGQAVTVFKAEMIE